MKLAPLAAYAVAAACVLVVAFYGLNRTLGAHPFWDAKVAYIGVPIGLVMAFVLRALKWRWVTRVFTFLALLTIAGTAAHQGRLQFAASFAENKLAGHFWYFGWIASAACATALIAACLTPLKGAGR